MANLEVEESIDLSTVDLIIIFSIFSGVVVAVSISSEVEVAKAEAEAGVDVAIFIISFSITFMIIFSALLLKI